MRVVWFDEAFDGGVFCGRDPAPGELYAGPLTLLGGLESQLGLTRASLGAGVRVGEAHRALSERAGFWSRSMEADALATAHELLRWYDTLRLHGWRGEGGLRLSALWQALAPVSEGVAQRIEAVLARLQVVTDVRFDVRRFDAAPLPKSWSALLRACADREAKVELPVASQAPVLAAAQHPGFVPDEGSEALQLIRPYGPVVAAEAIAVALATERRVPTVIIGSSPGLDAALHRHGLPVTGASQTPHDNVLGELLPLMIELTLKPADPGRAFELLALRQGPIRADVARALRHALERWPAVGSPEWTAALDRALSELETDEERSQARARVKAVFGGDASDSEHVPATMLLQRAGWLRELLVGRLRAEGDTPGGARLRAALTQIDTFTNLVGSAASTELHMTQVRRFLEEARAGMATASAFDAEAGFHVVSNPGAVVAPVSRIIWWDYTRSSGTVPRPLPLTPDEWRALEAAGVVFPTIAELTAQRARAFRRPFALAEQSLWLVSPLHEANGEEAAPHASWDELSARVADPQLLTRLVTPAPRTQRVVQRERAKSLPLVQPTLAWNGAALPKRQVESPSSVESLLGCSLGWALRYPLGLKAGGSATLSFDETSLGKLAHHVLLERTLRVAHATEDDAARHALQVLRDEGPSLVAALFLPGATDQRGLTEHVIEASARVLFRLLRDGWEVDATEKQLEGEAFGTSYGGFADLVLKRGRRRAVVDLKWAGAKYRRDSIASGTAFQLASYAELLSQEGFAAPTVAYFILTTQTLLSTDEQLAASNPIVSDWSPAATFELLQRAHRRAWTDVSKGHLSAPGVVTTPPETGNEDGELSFAPPCRFCEYDGICGRRYGLLEVGDEE